MSETLVYSSTSFVAAAMLARFLYLLLPASWFTLALGFVVYACGIAAALSIIAFYISGYWQSEPVEVED
jgi:hypothetical protein